MSLAPQSPRLPLDLVTGFLGAGKTTLINAVLRDPAFAGAMVVVNEFGEVGLDHLLVSSAQDNVVLLDSGCLCCAVSGTLRDTLIDLFSRRASGALAPFNRIIVETSGLANPGPLVASLLGDSALRPRCILSQVLTLVDAGTGLRTLDRYLEAQRQVAFADRLVISKVDLHPVSQVDALVAELAALHPSAAIARWQQADAPAPHFAPLPPGAGGRAAADMNLAPAFLGQFPSQYTDQAETHGLLHRHVRTHAIGVPQPISWTVYADWTDALRRRFHDRLLRCKGLLRFEGDDGLWVVQGVQGYFAPPYRLAPGSGRDAGGFLVCIGEALTRPDLLEALGRVDDRAPVRDLIAR